MIRHNYLAILVLLIVNIALGFLWYGLIFGETWSMATFGKTVDEMKEESMSATPYIINVIGVILTLLFLSWLVQKMNATTFSAGLTIGFYVAIGLIIPVIAIHYSFMMVNNKTLCIDLGMSTVTTLINAGVLAAWRKKAA